MSESSGVADRVRNVLETEFPRKVRDGYVSFGTDRTGEEVTVAIPDRDAGKLYVEDIPAGVPKVEVTAKASYHLDGTDDEFAAHGFVLLAKYDRRTHDHMNNKRQVVVADDDVPENVREHL